MAWIILSFSFKIELIKTFYYISTYFGTILLHIDIKNTDVKASQQSITCSKSTIETIEQGI